MQKKVIIIVVVAFFLIAAVVFYLLNSQKEQQGGIAVTTGKESNSNGNVVTSIKDALSKSVSLSCEYTSEQGLVTKTYIKNGAIRSDVTGQTQAETGSFLIKDNKVYSWTGKKGFMMQLPDVTKIPSQTGYPDQAVSEDEKVIESLEKYKQYCKPTVVDDSLFTPPADVTFSDASQMMKKVPTNDQRMQQYTPPQGNSAPPGY